MTPPNVDARTVLLNMDTPTTREKEAFVLPLGVPVVARTHLLPLSW